MVCAATAAWGCAAVLHDEGQDRLFAAVLAEGTESTDLVLLMALTVGAMRHSSAQCASDLVGPHSYSGTRLRQPVV